MQTNEMGNVIIEATNGVNWGKFMVLRFGPAEFGHPSALTGRSVLRERGWGADHLWVLDLETRQGAAFTPGGVAAADVAAHGVWVCPLFEPFLAWLYAQDLRALSALPSFIQVPRPAAAEHRPQTDMQR